MERIFNMVTYGNQTIRSLVDCWKMDGLGANNLFFDIKGIEHDP